MNRLVQQFFYGSSGLSARSPPKRSEQEPDGPVRVETTTYRYSDECGVPPVCLGTGYHWVLDGKRIAEGPVLPSDWATNVADGTLTGGEAGTAGSGRCGPAS